MTSRASKRGTMLIKTLCFSLRLIVTDMWCVLFTFMLPFCQMRRMTQLLKVIYGENMYKSKNHPDWVKLAEKPTYPVVPAQGPNECGSYVLRLTRVYDDVRLVERILKSDVMPFVFLLFWYYFLKFTFRSYDNLFLITGLHFFNFFSLLLKIGRRHIF